MGDHHTTKRERRLAAAVSGILILMVAGCGAGGMMAAMKPSASAGVTTGGAQDIGLARNTVAAGRIPTPEAFVVEGLLGEHDIDIDAPECEELFCMSTSVGVAPALDSGREAAFMVVGFSSSIDLGDFSRQPLNLSLVVDRSGSMRGGKMAAARTALHKLLEQLGPGDRLSIVAFDHDVDVVVPSVSLARGTASLHELIEEIEARGSTDIVSALAEGFDQVAGFFRPGMENRVMLITDARPNTGRADAGSFIAQAEHFAAQGIGLTVFGVGLDFGQELTLAISRIPGGNYFYLENGAKLARVFDRDFELLVTPVAWDFEMVVEPIEGHRIAAAYGVPSWVDDGGDGAVRIHIPTLFLSRNRGAIVLRLEPVGHRALAAGPLAHTTLAYRDRRAGVRAEFEEDVIITEVVVPDDPGVQKAVALVNTGLGLRQAARLAQERRYVDALDVLDAVDAVVAESRYAREQKLVEGFRNVLLARAPRAVDEPVYDRPYEYEPGRRDGVGTNQWIR